MTLHLLDDKTAPKSQRFRWQLKGRNGKIVAASSEGFSTSGGCKDNILSTFLGIKTHVVICQNGGVVTYGIESLKVRP